MKPSAIALGAIVLAFAASPGAAQHSRRNLAREKQIEHELEVIAPAAVATFRQATEAMDSGRRDDAIRLFNEVLKYAPGFTPAMRRLGGTLTQSGRRAEGLALARRAVDLQRSPENLNTLAQALITQDGDVPAPQHLREQALALAKEASTLHRTPDDSSYVAFVAGIALSLDREQDFREATNELTRTYPREAPTHYFAAIRAAMEHDWELAEREIGEAERLGLPHAAAAEFLASGVHTRASVWRYARYAAYLFVIWAGGLLLLFIAGRRLSSATLDSIERADPNQLATPAELSLRRMYRTLVRCAAIYYYVSLPFVVVLVIGGTAAVLYGFLLLGHIPVKLALLLGLGALITVFKMVQSLFVKVASEDPGRSMDAAEVPALWDLARGVAASVSTRPVDEIRVTPGTEMAVYERGSARERRDDQAARVLIVGTGLLNDFRQGAFRAVLAHEYGHFANRDTAGGEVALRVQQDMAKFAVAMIQNGQAVWWNLAFHFLRVYNFLFRRITHGATRLQEVLADRMAAHAYGPAHFEEGLRHVIRRTVEFNTAVSQELQQAFDTRRAVHNLYELPPPPGDEVNAAFEEALARPTSEDDTHPGPLDRFRLVHGVAYDGRPAASAMVWDLFQDRERLMTEMTRAVEGRFRDIEVTVPA